MVLVKVLLFNTLRPIYATNYYIYYLNKIQLSRCFPYITRNFNVQIWFTSAVRIRWWLRRTNCNASLGYKWGHICDNIQGPHRYDSIAKLGGRATALVQWIMWSIGDCMGCWRTTRHCLWTSRAQVNSLIYWFIFGNICRTPINSWNWIELNWIELFCRRFF